ncbi:hypothetical protein D3C73_912530 [compost metagenome]
MAQVGDFFLVNKQVAVAGDAPLVAAQHFQAGEQFAHKGPQQGRQQNEAFRMAGQLGRHLDQARQGARRLHHGNRGLPAEGVGARQRHNEIQALVVDAGKRMRRVQTDGGQQRHHIAVEHLARPLLLLGVPFGSVMQGDALCLHGGQNVVVKQVVLPRHQGVHGVLDVFEGLIRCHAVGAHQVGRLKLLLFQAGNPDFEEFIQIGTDDTHVPQPLQQRRRRIFRHRQHALVEFKQRQFTIHEQRLARRACGHTGFHTLGGAWSFTAKK